MNEGAAQTLLCAFHELLEFIISRLVKLGNFFIRKIPYFRTIIDFTILQIVDLQTFKLKSYSVLS